MSSNLICSSQSDLEANLFKVCSLCEIHPSFISVPAPGFVAFFYIHENYVYSFSIIQEQML